MKCPRCKHEMSKYPAISRRDNKTEICSECGIQEAMFDYVMAFSDNQNLKAIKEAEKGWLDA